MIKTNPKNDIPFDIWVDSQVKKYSKKKYKQNSRVKDVENLKFLKRLLDSCITK